MTLASTYPLTNSAGLSPHLTPKIAYCDPRLSPTHSTARAGLLPHYPRYPPAPLIYIPLVIGDVVSAPVGAGVSSDDVAAIE